MSLNGLCVLWLALLFTVLCLVLHYTRARKRASAVDEVTHTSPLDNDQVDKTSLELKEIDRRLKHSVVKAVIEPTIEQPYEWFLVLDVEGTCVQGHSFDYPNEIIEWPVCLLGWKHGALEVIDEFRSFVKPSWKPELTPFCSALTGISQDQVDDAPDFPKVIESMHQFMIAHKLLDPDTGKKLARFCWCTDGPWDICNFVVKQCFISKIKLPLWLTENVIDVRSTVTGLKGGRKKQFIGRRRQTMDISRQLAFLQLEPFQGRQHSGIDDTRNISRIVIELARREIRLVPNLEVKENKRWSWMGKSGRILEDKISP